jgi:hypothetical protein
MIITIIVIALAAIIGIGSIYVLKKPDNPVEQGSEDIIEDALENALHLPDGSLKDKIDLSPGSTEKN